MRKQRASRRCSQHKHVAAEAQARANAEHASCSCSTAQARVRLAHASTQAACVVERALAHSRRIAASTLLIHVAAEGASAGESRASELPILASSSAT